MMTTPNNLPPHSGQSDNESQPTTPIPAVQQPKAQAHSSETNVTDKRVYALSPQQLFQEVHNLLTTGATFTLDNEDIQTGAFIFHSYDGVDLILSLTAHGDTETAVVLSATNDKDGRRSREFFDSLDRRLNIAPAQGSRKEQGTVYNTATQQNKKTSKLAIFAIIIGILYILIAMVGLGTWSTLFTLAIFPALLTGFSFYTTRKNGKRQGRILSIAAGVIVVIGLVVGGISIVREKTGSNCAPISWPDSELVSQLPEPESMKGEIDSESEEYFGVYLCGVDSDEFNSYVEKVQDKGFTVDYSKTSNSFLADNEAGYSVIVEWDDSDNTMSISIDAPVEDEPDESESSGDDAADSSSEPDSQPDPQPQEQSTPDSSSPSEDDFKAAMDSYEAFFDKYVEFMNTYKNDGQPANMLADYLDMMSQYSDTMSKLDAIDESTLTPEQDQYYLEVMTRINQKLLSVAQ